MFQVNAELPDHIRGALPEAAQTRFRQVANSALGDGGSETVALRKAWVTVREGWQRGTKGNKWFRKTAANIQGDTHLDGFMSDKKKKDKDEYDDIGKFDADQARDEHGQWTSGGAGHTNSVTPTQPKPKARYLVRVAKKIGWASGKVLLQMAAILGTKVALEFMFAQHDIRKNSVDFSRIPDADAEKYIDIILDGVSDEQAERLVTGLEAQLDIKKVLPRSLYIYRPVVNAKEIIDWAKAQGFKTTMTPDDLHVTVLYSKRPVDWMAVDTAWSQGDEKGQMKVLPGGPRMVEPLGTAGAVVLLFKSNDLTWRHEGLIKNGASSDFNGYQAHITISWDAKDVDLSKVEPYKGAIILGPECFEEIKADWKSTVTEKAYQEIIDKMAPYEARIVKVDPGLGLVFGWAIICNKDGKPYYDLNVDSASGERVPEHIPESAMLKAAADFMENSRVHKEMHGGDPAGTAVFAFPMTEDIAKAMGIQTSTTGLLIAMKPNAAMLAKYKSGELKGFSIGGSRVKVREEES